MRAHDETILSVAGLNRAVRLGLETEWSDVVIIGEVGDYVRSAAGHLYFTLNDEREVAQLRVVMFQGDARRSRAKLQNGARVRIRGRLSLYEPRGTFQLIARIAFDAGEGDLARMFKELLGKLDAEGLTAPERKRPLPLLPRCVGVVTSDQGAAIEDILHVIERRCPVRVVVSPCLVQGPEAPRSIVRALTAVTRLPEVDVVILARGGGAAEDLWAFNDEGLARAIVACPVPVVSGVGHEVDVTIADLVADVRAATPSNAAERAVPERAWLEEKLLTLERALARALEIHIGQGQLRLSRLSRRLREPRAALSGARDKLGALRERLVRAEQLRRQQSRELLGELTRRLGQGDPRRRLSAQRASLQHLELRLSRLPPGLLGRGHTRLAGLAGRLEALSPLSVLGRGYAIAFSSQSGRVLRSSRDIGPGEQLRIRLHEGELTARVEAVTATPSPRSDGSS